MTSLLSTAVAAILTVGLVTPTLAANTRTWISGRGTDASGCGPIATPCRTLQYAHDNTVAGGEINVLDAAGYGSLTIDRAITIINDGAGVAGVLAASGGNGLTIAAGSTDDIVLYGLTIEGVGAGLNGVVFNSGRSLSIARCLVQNFSNSGIFLGIPTNAQTPATVRIADAILEKTGTYGIYRGSGPLRLRIDNTAVSRASAGIFLRPSAGATTVAINATHVSFAGIGIEFFGSGGTVTGSVDSSSVSHGGNIGFYTNASQSTMYLSRSVSTGFTAAANQGAGIIYSYGNNMFENSGASTTPISTR